MTPTTNMSPTTRASISLRAVKQGDPLPSVVRTVTFGGRDWSLGYYAKNNAVQRAQQTAIIVAAIGFALTGIVCGLFGYVAYNNLRLSREIQVRIGFERRLTAVIDELNHRVKNILAVIQSIVTRTLRHGSDMDMSRDLLIGRIHAMSNVVTLLSESQWQGVKLRGLFESRAIPHADRIVVNGPDIAVSARAAQSLSLLFFELASHSDEGLSLVGKHPHIVANWEVTGEEPDVVFHFRWEEFNTSAATRREDSDFGLILLDRVAPEALGGTAKRYFTDVSYVYELTAPMATVVDMTERDRTEQITAPVRPGEVGNAHCAHQALFRIKSTIDGVNHGTLSAAVDARHSPADSRADLRCSAGCIELCSFAGSPDERSDIRELTPASAPDIAALIRATKYEATKRPTKKAAHSRPPFPCHFDSVISRRCRRSRRAPFRRVRNPRRRRHRAAPTISSARG